MTEEEYKKYKEALLLFYGGGRFILNNRFLPGIPTLPDIQEYTITFTNLDYPDLPIDIPEPITDISGTVVTLPTMSGEYEDTYNYYTPDSWSIGSFGEEIELSDNLIANLVFNVVPKVVTYTVSFENTTYPDFDVSIPDSIIVPEGDSITLPSVSGEYEDEEYTYTPLKWSIGEFGEVITPDSNLTADLVWDVEPIQTYNIIGGLISEEDKVDWSSLSVLGCLDVDNINLYTPLYTEGRVSVDNIALADGLYMLGKLKRIYDPAIEGSNFVVYDTVEENIVSFYKEELGYYDIEHVVLNTPNLVIGIPLTVPSKSLFFTDNGREETNNTSLETGSTLPLYDEEGNLVTDEQSLAIYYNEAPLSYMKYDGNMMLPHDEDSLVDSDDSLALRVHDEEPETLEIDTTFGSEVTIPEGYVVDNIKSSALFINNATDVSGSGSTCTFGFRGENKYCDLVDTSLIGKGVAPCLQVWCVTTVNSSSDLRGYYVSYRSSQDPTAKVSTYTTKYLNSNGYSLYLNLQWSSSSVGSNIFTSLYANKYPVRLQYFDGNDTLVPYFFDVHKSLYNFSNGILTWNGDTTDKTNLAYYYSGRDIRIYCKRAVDIDVTWGSSVNIPEGYCIESVKSSAAFSFGSVVGTSTSTEATLQYNGKNIYSTDILTSDLGVKILPCLTVFQSNEWHNSGSYYEVYGYRLSTTPSYNNANSPLTLTNVTVNGSNPDCFVKFTITYVSGSAAFSNILTGIQTYPVMFRYRDIRDAVISYFFNLPTSLWKYNNGVFSWLGNGDDSSDIAFYYKRNQGGTPIRIRCVPTSSSVSPVKKAWSVQVEKFFTLSYSNIDHSDLPITIPSSESGFTGTSITLPTISGDYYSSGNLYTPSAWSIGAFGSSYTLTHDVVANLLFNTGVVSYNDDFGSNNWLATLDGTATEIADNGEVQVGVFDVDTQTYLPVAYDSSKAYALLQWQETQGTTAGRTEFEIINNAGYVYVKNVSGGSLTFLQCRVATCSFNNATIVTVYNSSTQEAFNAFKFTVDGTDYYYVVDNTQTAWTDDLSSIGYTLTVLPTVTKSNLRVEPDSNEHQIGAGSEKYLYEYVNSSYRGVLYDDTTKKQCAYGWRRIVSGAWESHYYGVSAVLIGSTSLGVRNDTQSTIYVFYLLYAECSDPTAVLVIVYNSSEEPRNAFRYTIDGVDYYYVLDGVQTDWTDDLSSIGYMLELPAYTEITLYMASGNKNAQTGVTSGFTGNVNSTYCYPLYTDAECTTRWNGYDYSNDYALYYGDVPFDYQSIADLPSATTSSGAKMAFVLMDTGCVWLASNVISSGYATTSLTSFTLRIYSKDQQYYAGYFNASSTYNNSSLTYGSSSSYPLYNKPNTGSDTMPRIDSFPDKEIVGFYGSAGNLVSSRYDNLSWLSGSPLRVTYRNSDSGTLSIRYMLYTLEEPTYYGWVNLTGNTSSSSGTAYRLRDKEGNYIPYESGVLYTVIGLFKNNGGSASGTIGYLNMSYMGKFNSSYPNDLCWMQQYGSVSVSYVWYIKKHVDTTGMAYCTDKGLNGGNKGSISNSSWYELYDADGNTISVDPSKQYVCTKAFLKDGTSVDNWSDGSYVDTSVCYVRLSSSSGTLKFNADPLPWTNSGYQCYSMSYIELQPDYTEITVYGDVLTPVECQNNVTSGFTGNASSSNMVQLYTDEEKTIPFEFDYSNDYELGYYSSGVWVSIPIQSIDDMPSTTANPANSETVTKAYLLYDTGELWFVCNNSNSGYGYNNQHASFYGSRKLRIRSKEQQQYSLYLNPLSVYENKSNTASELYDLYGKAGSSLKVPVSTANLELLKISTIVDVLGSSGNSYKNVNDYLLGSSGYLKLGQYPSDIRTFRTVVFSLPAITYSAWINTTKTNEQILANTVTNLYDDAGNLIPFDSGISYVVLGLFRQDGTVTTDNYTTFQNTTLVNNSGMLAYKNASTLSNCCKVWYYMYIDVNFGDAVTIPSGYTVQNVMCSRGYVFASSVSISGTQVDYELPGEKVYFDDINTSLVGVQVKPALQITVINTLSQTIVATLSSKYGDSGTRPSSASASYVNSGGYSVKGTADYSSSSVGQGVVDAMQTFPVYFNLSNTKGDWLYYCFRVPQTLWQFSGGVFSWLGDTTSFLDLAYWYNSRAVRIYLKKI